MFQSKIIFSTNFSNGLNNFDRQFSTSCNDSLIDKMKDHILIYNDVFEFEQEMQGDYIETIFPLDR